MYKYLHHISDFMVATAHLSPVEECFYRRALDFYYLNEKPLPKETQSVFRRLRANTQEERDAVLIVLQEFFVEEEDGFHNKRCDSEIAAYQKVGDKNRENGKKGGRPRKEKPKENQSEGDSVNSENPQKPSGLILGSESESQKNLNHKPLTDNQYIDSSSNAREENSQFTPIQFAQYQIDDHKRYSMREFISEYSEFQYDFISLAQQRFVSVPEIDLRTMIQNFGDWYFANESSSLNTPSIWLVKWFSWVQNNEKQVAANRKKQEQITSTGQKPQESGYFANLFEEQSESQIVDVTPAKKFPMIEEVGLAWCFGKKPDCEFIHISYSAMLAANNAFQIRTLVQEEAYKKVFPDLTLRDDSKAKDFWRTSQGGVCYATGTGGTITGFGAGKLRDGFGGCIIIDDPHKAHEASSKTIREGVIDWFQNTLESRTNSPDTPIIVIMQRLHEDDLAGWLLGDRKDGVPVAGGNGEVWEHLCLSAIQEDGSALWPAKHNIQKLRQMEQAAPYVFAGQYRQMPSPPAGGFFKPDNIQIVDALPADVVKQVRAWDFGATENEGDFTAGVREALGADGFTYIVDVTRGQLGPDNVNKRLKQTTELDGKNVTVRIPQDPGQAGKSQALAFTKLLSGYHVVAKPVSGDKITRAQPFAAQVNVGNVRMLKGDWNKAFIEELRNFPNGTNDDQVDGGSDAFNELHEGFETFFADMGFAR